MMRRELQVFLIVGVLTVLVDFATYHALLWQWPASVGLAKAVGFLTGTVFAYFANRFWTFGHRTAAPGSVVRFGVLYALTLGVNVAVNAVVLHQLPQASPWSTHVAFVMATGTSAALNFAGMKWFVFKAANSLERA